MPDDPVTVALEALGMAHHAVRAAIDALHQTPAGRKYTNARHPDLAVPEPPKGKRKPVPAVPSSRTALPEPMTPAPRPKPTVSSSTRAENFAAVVHIAKRVIAVVGPDSPLVRDAVAGQVALDKVPADDDLIADAISTALQG